MTPIPPESTVRTDAELFALWQSLMGAGGFGQRSLWLIFLDHDGRVRPVIVPFDGIAAEPDPLFVRNLVAIVAKLVSGGDAASVAMLLSRPGDTDMTAGDRRWARAVRAELGAELSRWPIHLATCDRVQVFAPDDLLAAS